MKRLIFALLAALLMLCVFTATAMAEAVDVAPAGPTVTVTQAGDLPAEPFTWTSIATIGGAAAATLLIVQLLKLPLDRIWKIPTRIWVYIIALALMLCATAFTEGLDFNKALLTAVNAVIVALAAMGTYEMTFGRQKAPPDGQ